MTVFEVIGMGAKKYGGFERYILEEAKQLAAKKNKLVVVFDSPPKAEQYVKDLKEAGAEIVVLSYANKKIFAKVFFSLLKKYRPQVVHTNFSSNLFLVHALSLMYGVKTRISTEHCLPVVKSVRQRLTYAVILSLSTYVLSVSKESCNAILSGALWGKRKVKTLYLGVSDFSYDRTEMAIKYGIDQSKFALVNIAYHNPVKGVDILLKAMDVLVNQKGYKDIILYQIGGGQTGKDTEMLKSMEKELNLSSNIVWMGLQNNVPEILSACDLFCQPSRSEGIPLSIMEASLAKLPTVASRVGGIPESAIDGKNAILVPPEKPNALAAAIEILYKDSQLRIEMGELGREHALNNFCLANQVNKLINCYYKL